MHGQVLRLLLWLEADRCRLKAYKALSPSLNLRIFRV